MLLTDIKKYMSEQPETNLEDIANALHTEQSLIEQGMEHWIAKGKVDKKVHIVKCSNCGCGCGKDGSDKNVIVTYTWKN